MENKKNVPAIRFKGFDKLWNKIEMSEVATFNPKAELPEAFEYVDLESVVGTKMISHRTEYKLSAPSRAQRLAKRGDLFYQTVRPYQKNNYLFDKDKDNYIFSTGYAQLRPHGNGCFLLALVQGEVFVKTVLDKCTGTSYPAISSTDLSKIKVLIPDKNEQKSIGNYFQNIDRLINKSQAKLDKLKTIKKACLDKMFPRNGSNIPEIRFKGFIGKWREKSFAEVAKVKRGLTYTPTNIRNEGVRVLRSSNINEDTFVISKDDVFVAKDAVNITYAKDKDILITSANGSSRLVGKHTIISGIVNKSTVHGGFMLLATATEPYFVNASMSSSWYQKFINLYVAGGNGAIGNLNKSDLEKQLISVPISEEQKAVGRFFKKLDKLTALTEQKIEKLKNIKRACLDKMFVNRED